MVELIPRITAFLIVGSIVTTDHKRPHHYPYGYISKILPEHVINNGTTSVETIPSLYLGLKYGKTIKLATTAPEHY